ncbi:MAG: hypothetical protein WD734_04630 [Dehalococcoidia bacterium]
MTPEEREALLAGYALGSLSTPDARDAERLVRSDPDAAARMAEYQELADLIALSVPLREADPRLRERVLAAARPKRMWRPGPVRRYLPVAGMAAALGAVTIWAVSLQTTVTDLQRQADDLTAVVQEASKRLDRLGEAADGAREANAIDLTRQPPASEQHALVAVSGDPNVIGGTFESTTASHGATGEFQWSDAAGAGTVTVRDLPRLPLGGAYRVWVEDSLSRLMVAATFTPDDAGRAQEVLTVEGRLQPERIYVIATSRADDPESTGPVVLMATIDR